jgi:hypothetical protein
MKDDVTPLDYSKKMEIIVMQYPYILFITIFAKFTRTLRVTKAMEAGLTKSPMEIEDIVRLAD